MKRVTSFAASSSGAANSFAISKLISWGEWPATSLAQMLIATRFNSKAGRPATSMTALPSEVVDTRATPDTCNVVSPFGFPAKDVAGSTTQLFKALHEPTNLIAQLLRRCKFQKESFFAFWVKNG